MRCFIAIDIDDKMKAGLSRLQNELANKVNIRKSDVKWVGPEAMHLTLKFLGEVKDNAVVPICDAVKNVAQETDCFQLDTESVGYFGGRSARVLWVGTGDSSKNLEQLQKDIEESLVPLGWPKENRKFSGHLTLCRIRNAKAGIKLAKVSEEYKDFRFGTIYVDSVSVYQSQLYSSGPAYILLGNYKLR